MVMANLLDCRPALVGMLAAGKLGALDQSLCHPPAAAEYRRALVTSLHFWCNGRPTWLEINLPPGLPVNQMTANTPLFRSSKSRGA
jgi:hypothetical protein